MKVMIRWRNDNDMNFENEREQEVSKELDYLFFRTPGIYRTRQYELTFTDNAPFTLINLEEEVKALGS